MIQNVSATMNVTAPAMTWFLVVLEMNSPIEMNDAPSSSRPRYPATIGFHSGSPRPNRIPMCTSVTASIAA